MVEPKDIIQLSKRAFWDVDMNKLDYEKQSDAIIVRVFERGSWEDILEVTAFYGSAKVINALVTAAYLPEKTIAFASNMFHIPPSSFKCYTTRQYHPV
ncbi:MAG: hypothetical protein M3040_15885 [Bacteroidota bacterium]|nr:hypothetical protein [Bacteroidota bacterium]